MKLFLASDIAITSDLCIATLGLTPSKDVLAYIPTAQECYNTSEDATARGSYQGFAQKGFEVLVCRPGIQTKDEVENILQQSTAIIISGGNTYYLLQELQRVHLLERIRAFSHGGGAYIGSSAGSILASSDIAYINDTDDKSLAPHLADTQGLGFVDVSIYPHCVDDWFKDYTPESIRAILHSRDKRILLHDEQALLVKDGFYKIVQNGDTSQLTAV